MSAGRDLLLRRPVHRLRRLVRELLRPRGAAAEAEPRYQPKRWVLDPEVLRGSLEARAAVARRRAGLVEATERERRFLESSASYAEAVRDGSGAASVQHRIELDGLTWWVPMPTSGDSASVARVVSHQDFPYRTIVQTRELAIGGLMLDIGGNNGRMSIPRVILGDVLAAYCAEPDPNNYACLVRNVRDNGLAGLVLPDRVAIGARDGPVRLLRGKSSGGHQIIDRDAQATRETIDVPCLTLDNWCARLGLDLTQVSFVKLDVQGSENDVLAGATQLLGCRHIVWQIEVDLWLLGERGIAAGAFFDALRPHFSHWLDLNKRAKGARVRPIDQLVVGLAYLSTGSTRLRTDVLLFTLQDPFVTSGVRMSIHKVLVTGGAGYIGSHLVDRLVAREYVVTVLDNLEPQVHRSGTWPVYANPTARYVRGDVRDRAVFEPLVLDADAVVHFGAAVSVGQSMYQVDRYVDVNTRGTALLLDILVNNRHHVQKMIVASSIGVYGEGAYECPAHGAVAPGIRAAAQLAARDWEQRCPICQVTARSVPTPEAKPLYRDNIYSMTKYHQEEMVLLIGKTYGIPAVAPRFFNVYGPRQSLSNPYAGVAAIWLSRLLNGKPPVVFEDGGQLRDFVSIHDVVDCLVLMLENPGADYLPVNVGSGDTVTILEIARLLNRLLGTSIEPQVTQTGRTFDIRHNTADITRARETLGYAPTVSLEEGFTELIEWAKTAPDAAVDFFDQALRELQDKGLVVKS